MVAPPATIRPRIAFQARWRWLALALALIALLLALPLAACAGSSDAGDDPPPVAPTDGTLTVRAFEWGYEPSGIVLQRGEQVRIVLENDGLILHNLKVEKLEADVIESRSTGPLTGSEGQLFVGAEAGRQGTLIFVPEESGTFTFYCTIQGHRQFGMEGVLTVE